MLANLRALFGVVVDIVFLRRGPEHLPASNAVLGVVVAVYVALYGLAYQAFILPLRPGQKRLWLLQIAVAALIELLWFRAAFQMAGKPERFVQTAIAVFATSTLFIPALALAGLMIPYINQGASQQAPALLTFLSAFIVIWMLTITIRIVRAAFEWTWPFSILFVFALNVVPAIVLSIIFGGSPKPT